MAQSRPERSPSPSPSSHSPSTTKATIIVGLGVVTGLFGLALFLWPDVFSISVGCFFGPSTGIEGERGLCISAHSLVATAGAGCALAGTFLILHGALSLARQSV